MKYVLAILLSLSLYAPDVAKLVAYADYAVDIATNKKINICDCEPILDNGNNSDDHSDHQLTAKYDWKYLTPNVFAVNPEYPILGRTYAPLAASHLSRSPKGIFQPPKV